MQGRALIEASSSFQESRDGSDGNNPSQYRYQKARIALISLWKLTALTMPPRMLLPGFWFWLFWFRFGLVTWWYWNTWETTLDRWFYRSQKSTKYRPSIHSAPVVLVLVLVFLVPVWTTKDVPEVEPDWGSGLWAVIAKKRWKTHIDTRREPGSWQGELDTSSLALNKAPIGGTLLVAYPFGPLNLWPSFAALWKIQSFFCCVITCPCLISLGTASVTNIQLLLQEICCSRRFGRPATPAKRGSCHLEVVGDYLVPLVPLWLQGASLEMKSGNSELWQWQWCHTGTLQLRQAGWQPVWRGGGEVR